MAGHCGGGVWVHEGHRREVDLQLKVPAVAAHGGDGVARLAEDVPLDVVEAVAGECAVVLKLEACGLLRELRLHGYRVRVLPGVAPPVRQCGYGLAEVAHHVQGVVVVVVEHVVAGY